MAAGSKSLSDQNVGTGLKTNAKGFGYAVFLFWARAWGRIMFRRPGVLSKPPVGGMGLAILRAWGLWTQRCRVELIEVHVSQAADIRF